MKPKKVPMKPMAKISPAAAERIRTQASKAMSK